LAPEPCGVHGRSLAAAGQFAGLLGAGQLGAGQLGAGGLRAGRPAAALRPVGGDAARPAQALLTQARPPWPRETGRFLAAGPPFLGHPNGGPALPVLAPRQWLAPLGVAGRRGGVPREALWPPGLTEP
jgi:hypothetical protein